MLRGTFVAESPLSVNDNLESGPKSPLFVRPASRHLCQSRTVYFACVILGVCLASPVQAQERGEIGGELSAGLGELGETSDGMYLPHTLMRLGLSGWYRLMPAVAIGLSWETLQNGQLDGSNSSQDTFIEKGKALRAFVDGRLFPSWFVGAFGRASVGVAHLNLVPTFTPGPTHVETAYQPMFELEAGPELRIFFLPRSKRPRPDIFLRVRGTATVLPEAFFFGYGLSLGFEG